MKNHPHPSSIPNSRALIPLPLQIQIPMVTSTTTKQKLPSSLENSNNKNWSWNFYHLHPTLLHLSMFPSSILVHTPSILKLNPNGKNWPEPKPIPNPPLQFMIWFYLWLRRRAYPCPPTPPMELLSWSCYGFAQDVAIQKFKGLLGDVNLDCIFLSET